MAGRIRDEGADIQAASPETPAFDRWLHRQLHALYDTIAREPLPDDLVALIDRDVSAATRKVDRAITEV